MRLFFVLLLVVALVSTGLWVLLPWWGFGLAVGLGVVVARLARRGVEQLSIRHRSKALEGAQIEICSIAPTHFPGFIKGIDEVDEAKDPRRYFLVEVSVHPGEAEAAESWAPRDLRLVPVDGSPEVGESEEEVPVQILELAVAREDEWVAAPEAEIEGPAKLRLHIGVLPGNERLALEYALARLEELQLPLERSFPYAAWTSRSGSRT